MVQVLSLLSFPLLIFLLVEELMGEPVRDYSKSRYVPLIHLPMTIAFVLVDVVMIIILLIGAHKLLLVILTSALSIYMSYIRNSQKDNEDIYELPNLVVNITELVLEFVITIVLIVALHRKHLLLMKCYMYLKIVFLVIGFIYSIAVLIREIGDELFLILFELIINIYMILIIWSMIKKTERDDTVTYTREA
ncbi:unnamed protein product [Danaus chrysippus]|uniref:(African queen) hypothetical protein n=1 Tax=Danaus chrysippus TaxID=151541 RepID=A0A8J2WD36_9NEOP|nr:unnamed protein product [Danaus chrysippus]